MGTPKAHLRRFEQALVERDDWQEVEPGQEVKLLAAPEGNIEQFVLCRSAARRQKEAAIFELQRQRLVAKLQEIDALAELPVQPKSLADVVEKTALYAV